ncbi:MAG: Os1348 family NHLP clan protein [Thermoanaerobaculia bacterium]
MMSQRNVEKVIGRLVTDEGFRRRFAEDKEGMLQEALDHGLDLNPCERRALLGLDARSIAQFAEQLDPCIQKVELRTHNAQEAHGHAREQVGPGATPSDELRAERDGGQGDDS